ncbi:elongation factor P [Gimibacter soli]|uniref:Elongation factor P n=1 Tax=Gimibacter soli TaxID=3024400 RepID=A0AAE9XTE7_9PROT|nr:elongation factor P [Gimibacter soli]WCL53930.1 elongation factor P [Gimibacter soli]
MKIDGNSIRIGNVLEHNGGLWRVTKTQHTMPGKGGAFMQVEMKNLRDGTKLNERFRSADKVERVTLEQRDYQFLYAEGEKFIFMNQETYDQIELTADDIGEASVFLQDNMIAVIEFFEETPLGVSLPEKVVLEVTETEPVVKGQTAASSYKPAIMDNGIRVMVPPFINIGDRIVVLTETHEYSTRAE